MELCDVESARAKVQRTARGEQGQIVVGFTSSAPFHPFVPRVLRMFREENPRVSVVLEEGGTVDLVTALRGERLDAAFIRSLIPDGEGVSVHALLDEDMCAALPAGHRLARGKKSAPLELADLAHEPFVLYRRASGPGLNQSRDHPAHLRPRVFRGK